MDNEAEEALSWAGDDDSSLLTAELAESQQAKPRGEEQVEAAERLSTFWPVLYGVFMGVFLLYLVGWAIFIFNNPVFHLVPGDQSAVDVIVASMYEFGEALTIALPLIWLAAVFMTIPAEKKVQRLTWLLLGVVLLVPWPFVVGGLV